MMTYRGALGCLITLPLAACGSTLPSGDGESSNASQDDDDDDDDDDDGSTAPDPSSPTTDGGSQETGTGTTGGNDDDEPDCTDCPKFDVHGANVHEFCDTAEAGVYCKDGSAITCDGAGGQTSQSLCTPEICLQGEGCVQCLAGQYHCQGPRVMECNTSGADPYWDEIDVCNPAAGEGCDQGQGICTNLGPVGGNVPTGEYYQYAYFGVGASGYMGGYDVDCFEDKLYVSSNFGGSIDVYQVTIEDGDGGGIKPNQHPLNPDEPGEIEPRTIELIESIPGVTVSSSQSEVLALEDRIYVGGSNITEYVFGEGSTLVTSPPAWSGWFAQIGYDDINGVWYASNENQRRVFQYDADSDSWGIAFMFPNLAGDHMDGMEVVTDPDTGTPYVYVSDMTSDFIGQYRLDADLGWVQENLFGYVGTPDVVEGFGFGTFNHFWAAGGNSVYELGGGDITDYVEPEPVG
jgi:hypothetical protein